MNRKQIEAATRLADGLLAEMEALRALVGPRQERLAQAVGASVADGLAKTVAGGVANALAGRDNPGATPTETPTLDDVMHSEVLLSKAVDAVVQVTGETDPAKIAAWIIAASGPVDPDAEHDVALTMAKA